MDCPADVAQASSTASAPGVPPGVRAGGETPPQLAAGTAALRVSWKVLPADVEATKAPRPGTLWHTESFETSLLVGFIGRWTLDVRCSMFDVRCWSLKLGGWIFCRTRPSRLGCHGLTAVPSRRRTGSQYPGCAGYGYFLAASSLMSTPQPGASLT